MNFANLKIKDISCIVKYTTEKSHWRAKNRKNHIIGIQLTGCARHDFGYKDIILSQNTVFFFNQKDDYIVDVSEKGTAYSVHFTTYEPIDTNSFCKKINNPNEIIQLLSAIDRLFSPDSTSNLLTLSQFYKLCNLILEYNTAPYNKQYPKILKSKEYINFHFKDKDCLKKSVEISGVSQRRFNDIFKTNFNTTPQKYIINLKILNGKSLHKLDELSVSKISEICGFSDVYYFSRTFKAVTGMTPSEYRKDFKNK